MQSFTFPLPGFKKKTVLTGAWPGIIGYDKINWYKALEIGLSLMNRIIGGDFGSVKFHKKDKVLSLKAVNSSVKIENDVVTVTQLLYSREYH